jgi:hypothetical protein
MPIHPKQNASYTVNDPNNDSTRGTKLPKIGGGGIVEEVTKPGLGLGVECRPDPIRQISRVAGSGGFLGFLGLFEAFWGCFGLFWARFGARGRARARLRSGSFNIRADPPDPISRIRRIRRQSEPWHETK